MKYMEPMSIPNHNYFFYKQPFKGSYKKMRFWVACELPEEDSGGKQYLAITYPDALCFEKTEEEKKQSRRFPFSEEGRVEVLEWLDRQYDEIYLHM